MDPQAALTMGQNALFLLLMVAAPVLATVLGVGLVVSLFQAITQIHEATLSFVPKLIAAIAVFAIAGPWMMTTMVEFIRNTILSIPNFAVKMGHPPAPLCGFPPLWRACGAWRGDGILGRRSRTLVALGSDFPSLADMLGLPALLQSSASGRYGY